jgi:signal transduction histidine kinase/purine-cytosine permease-like protein
MIRAKREYQSWVANESLEDYALRYAARSFRRWSPFVVANTAIGGISFLALEAIGGSITISYGFQNAMPAIVLVSIVIFLVSLPIAYHCSKANVDIDLLTRGAGFGFIGSTITSLIYASFTFIFFAIEAAIMAQALELAIGLNIVGGYLVSSLVIIPLVFFGVTLISKLQMWTQPIWVVLLILPFVFLLYQDPALLGAWSSYFGNAAPAETFNILMFGAATGVLFSLVVQIGEQADYLRFLPDLSKHNRGAWWAAMLSAGPGWIIIGGLKIVAGSLLAVAAIRMGSSASQAVMPMHMYTNAYESVFDNRGVALGVAALFVIISQIKINVTNAYGGSLAWSNCFARLAHYHPGRVVWLVFNVIIALLLTLLGIFSTLEAVLSVYSSVAIAWVGALLADLVVLKPLGVSPSYIEFKRAHLYNINPVGCGALLIGSAVSINAYGGAFGDFARAFFAFVALGVAFVCAIAIAYLTKGKYYIARADHHYRNLPIEKAVQCCICEKEYEPPDMAHCPFYRGPICSLCCGLDNHCHDFCKQPEAVKEAHADYRDAGGFAPHFARRVGRFFSLFSVVAAVMGAVFLLTYRLVEVSEIATASELTNLLVRLYVATLVVCAVATWWIVLSHESHELTAAELLQSVHYLEMTRKELVESEKMASLGGLVAGVAHEINTPVGITVSAASYLQDRTDDIRKKHTSGSLTSWDLESYLDDTSQSARLLLANANRAARLVQSFKQVAVDQTSDERRRFDLHEYLEETLLSVRPKLVEASAKVHLECPTGIQMDSYPGPLAQVVTNLLLNSLNHAFDGSGGSIAINASLVNGQEVVIIYRDNGRGFAVGLRDRIFEPFVTTSRGSGGSGLGLHLVYSIVTRKLNGSIVVEHSTGSGAAFVLRIPRVCLITSNVVHVLNTTRRSAANE